jgi:hypothetical protein
MYIHYDGGFYPNINSLDPESIEAWLDWLHPNLDCNACVWMIPGTVDPND